ncbi:MAG: ABC transporter substrate-binding protein [Bacteroidales bacterium]|nr:ABC transporter substrate-binding protein [Bacteroidales bacterium]
MRSFFTKAHRLTLLAICLVTAVGCHNDSVRTNDTDTITDDYGSIVVVPSNPKRIVSASPAITEIIFALGGQEKLIGRTEFCTYPPEAAMVENIGGISNLNVEKIASLHPDLVISGSMIPQKSVQQLGTLGIPVVCVIEKKHFDGLYENIKTVGQLINRPDAADSLNIAIRTEIHDLQQTLAQDSHHPTVYYVVGYGSGGNFTAGGESFINDIITMSGGENIAQDIRGWSYSIEKLISNDPDYIIVRSEDSAAFCNTHPYERLSAVRQGRVIGINSGLLDLQAPRNVGAIRFLNKRLHPIK